MAGERHQTADIGNIFEMIARDLGEKIVAEVMPTIRREIAAGFHLDAAKLDYTEEQAAAELDMSVQKLRQLAKSGEIGFSYSIVPTQYDKVGRAQNGRRVYMRHHIINYLLKNEIRPATTAAGDVTPAEVYQFSGDKKLRAA